MDDLGTELPRRTSMAWILAGAALVLAVPTVSTASLAREESGGTAFGAWAMTTVMALLLVAVPLLLARSILRRRTYVSDEAVTVTTGDGEVRRRVAFADVDEVRVRFSGQGGQALRNERVFLVGGPDGGVLVSRAYVETVRPLLDRLATEVARRPELLTSDVERAYFEQARATSR